MKMCSELVMEIIQTSLREMQIKTTMSHHLTLPRQCDFFILIVSLCTRSPSEPGGPACSTECRWQGSAEESPRVHKGSLLVGVQPVGLLWFQVYKHSAAIHQREDNEVRGAGGESFLPLFGWWESNDCDAYVAVRSDGYDEGCQKDTQSKDKEQCLNKPGVRAGEMDQGPRSQKKWGVTWGPQKDNWDSFTTRPAMRLRPKAKQAVTRTQQVLRFMAVA